MSAGLVSAVREWSTRQIAIFAWVAEGVGSAIVEAVAGSGKTTTLVEVVKRIPSSQSVAFAAYNKSIAVEIESRVKGLVNVKAGTFHSFGFAAWRQVAPKVKMDGKKLSILLTSMPEIDMQFHTFCTKAVSLAKQWGIGAFGSVTDRAQWDALVDRFDLADSLTEPKEKVSTSEMERRINTAIEHSMTLLLQSIRVSRDLIDFDDMIYQPVQAGCRVRQYDWVLVDEAQDTNPCRLALATMMLKPNGRLIAVGDPHQAIYGFAGADSESLNKIAQQFSAITLPLNVSYRCPRAVVAHAQQWVSHIEAAPNAPEGSVSTMLSADFDKLDGTMLRRDDAILCRLTAPLVKLAFGFIRRKIACHVEGRDIGAGLIALAKKWKVKTVGALRGRLADYLDREVAKAMAKNDEMKAESIRDKVETLQIIMADLPDSETVETVVSSILSLFGDTPEGEKPKSLTLCTVHRSKGREWNRVYIYGRTKWMPSKFAKQDWQREQETNLIYVAVTRSQSELIEVEV